MKPDLKFPSDCMLSALGVFFTLSALSFFLLIGCQSDVRRRNVNINGLSKEPAPPPAPLSQAPPENCGPRPVYILPTFATAYVAGKADPVTGEYIGAHNVTSIIEAAHWASQEEAELQGKPYVLPDSNEIVYPREGTREKLRPGAGQLEYNLAAKRYSDKNSKGDNSPLDAARRFPEPSLQETADRPPQSLADGSENQDGFTVSLNSPDHLEFSGGRPGQTYTVPLANGATMTVRYLTPTRVELASGSKSNTVEIESPSDKVRVKLRQQ